MSYEGHTQVICEKGHYGVAGAFGEDYTCHVCGSPAAWTNEVDDTNCDSYGEIPLESLQQFVLEPAQFETCPHCKHSHYTTETVYRVPTHEETEPLRCHRPDYGGTPLVLIVSSKEK